MLLSLFLVNLNVCLCFQFKLSFPELKNDLSPPDDITSQTTSIPNLKRKTAPAGNVERPEEQMKILKTVAKSSLTFKSFTSSNQSEQFMLVDITKYKSKSIYKRVPIVTDTDEESDKD